MGILPSPSPRGARTGAVSQGQECGGTQDGEGGQQGGRADGGGFGTVGQPPDSDPGQTPSHCEGDGEAGASRTAYQLPRRAATASTRIVMTSTVGRSGASPASSSVAAILAHVATDTQPRGRPKVPSVTTRSTREANARFFANPADVPRRAITMGIGTILRADEIVLLAYGAGKAEAAAAMIEGPMSAACPASALQMHRRTTVVLDEAAAGKLTLREYYEEVHPGGRSEVA